MAGFEEAAQKAIDDDDENPTGTAAALAWQNYVYDDATESAWFTLTSNLTT